MHESVQNVSHGPNHFFEVLRPHHSRLLWCTRRGKTVCASNLLDVIHFSFFASVFFFQCCLVLRAMFSFVLCSSRFREIFGRNNCLLHLQSERSCLGYGSRASSFSLAPISFVKLILIHFPEELFNSRLESVEFLGQIPKY